MHSLQDRLASGPKLTNRTNQRCRTCAWLDGLKDDDRESFNQAVISKAWTLSELRLIAKDFGLEIGESGFRSHVKEHTTSPK